jgi:hypothetical protein
LVLYASRWLPFKSCNSAAIHASPAPNRPGEKQQYSRQQKRTVRASGVSASAQPSPHWNVVTSQERNLEWKSDSQVPSAQKASLEAAGVCFFSCRTHFPPMGFLPSRRHKSRKIKNGEITVLWLCLPSLRNGQHKKKRYVSLV